MKSNLVIFGKNGQIGSNLVKIFDREEKFNLRSFSSSQVDFSKLENLSNFLNELSPKPDFIINAAAYTLVDKAEDEKELADLINHRAVKIIAEYAAKNNIVLIHYSTDYVFDGSGNNPFSEADVEHLKPLNHYGKTKLDAEKAIIASGCKHIILRTSWIYDENGKNFVNTITKLAKEKEVLSVISDQIGSPTSAFSVANSTLKIIKQLLVWSGNFPGGIYHCVANKYLSWHEFACDIIKGLREKNTELKVKEIKAIKTSEYKTSAVRPLNSRLNCDKLKNIFGIIQGNQLKIIDNAELIEFSLFGDARGSLISIESFKTISFDIKRVYYIFNNKFDEKRGFHAHKKLNQVLVCVSGKCKVLLDNGKEKKEVTLSSPSIGLYIRGCIWREMFNFSADCVLMVLADEYYDEKDYLRNYEDFLKEVNQSGAGCAE